LLQSDDELLVSELQKNWGSLRLRFKDKAYGKNSKGESTEANNLSHILSFLSPSLQHGGNRKGIGSVYVSHWGCLFFGISFDL